MLQLLPMIAGLLQSHQKQGEQKKQDEMAAYMGSAPSSGGAQGGGMLSGLTGMLQGLGGEKKTPEDIQNTVANRYKGDVPGAGPTSGPVHDPFSTEANMGSLSVPSYSGARDYDEDDQL